MPRQQGVEALSKRRLILSGSCMLLTHTCSQIRIRVCEAP
jgi:hypothetical protein